MISALLIALWCGLIWAAPIPYQSASVTLPTMKFDKIYQAMEGPNRHQFLKIDLPKDVVQIWLKGLKVSVKTNGTEAPHLLCHTRLGTAFSKIDVNKVDLVRFDSELGMQVLIGASQGHTEIDFPEGFAIKVRLPPGRRALLFGAQLQNPVGPTQFDADVTATVNYVPGPVGQQKKLKALSLARFEVLGEDHVHGSHANGHFVVPPGRHVFSNSVWPMAWRKVKDAVSIHYMRTHLHAYAKSIEIYDETTRKSLWKGLAVTNPKTESLEKADFYSSVEGFKMYPTHRYTIKVEYDNPTAKPVDGMAFIQAYYRRAL